MDQNLLETILNEYPGRDYEVEIRCPEFTCLCPGKRNQPDFAVITITYIPNKVLLELKSLKYYIVNFRNKEIFHEAATNKILEDLVEVLDPKYIRVYGEWNIRGGIKTNVEVEYPENYSME